MKAIALPIIAIAISLCNLSCIGTNTVAQTSGLSYAELASVPKGSKEVVIKGTDGALLFDNIISVLLQRGHRIIKDDKERLYILTEGKDIGESTLQRMTIAINSSGEATIKSEWMPGQDATIGASAMSGINFTPSWSIAVYTTGRPAIAFAEAVAIGKAVGGDVSYK